MFEDVTITQAVIHQAIRHESSHNIERRISQMCRRARFIVMTLYVMSMMLGILWKENLQFIESDRCCRLKIMPKPRRKMCDARVGDRLDD